MGNLQVRFLEGWAPAMAPGHSTLTGGRVARSGVIRRSDARYALDAKAAIFRRAWRLLPALAAILIPASVLSKKSAMLSRSASGRISLCFFALVSTRISV